MKTMARVAALLSLCAALFGVSTLVSAGGHPAPPPDVLCGCACPDGSIVITHAPDEDSCPSVCATACQGAEEF